MEWPSANYVAHYPYTCFTLEKGRGIFMCLNYELFFHFCLPYNYTCYVLLVGFVTSYGHGQHKPGDWDLSCCLSQATNK